MDAPTGEDIRSWAPPLLSWGELGFPAPTPPDPDPLDQRALWAVGQLYAITGRTLASITLTEEEAIAQQVLVAFAVIGAQAGSEAALEVAAAPWLKAFSAGSYSETRFSPMEMSGGTTKGPPYPPQLWALLWALMTPEKQDEWTERLTGVRRPAGAFIEVDWDDRPDVGPMIWGPGIENW